MKGRGRVHQARPGVADDLRGEADTVKCQILVPDAVPVGVIGSGEVADLKPAAYAMRSSTRAQERMPL